jgi:hypothetical protein
MERSAIAVVGWTLGWQFGGGLARRVPLAPGDAYLVSFKEDFLRCGLKTLDLIEGRGNNMDSLK